MCNTLDSPIEFKHKVALTDKTQIKLFFKHKFFFFMIKFEHLVMFEFNCIEFNCIVFKSGPFNEP